MTKISFDVTPDASRSQIDAIPYLGQLLNPRCVLIAQYRSDGLLTVSASVLEGGVYKIWTSPDSFQAGTGAGGLGKLSFDFRVDPRDEANPDSALLIERTDCWILPWDDEVAYVLGGTEFPFGADPVPLESSKSGDEDKPRAELGGTFDLVAANHAELSLIEEKRVSTSQIDELKPGTPSAKSLSLWLKEGVVGQLTICWSTPTGQACKEFDSVLLTKGILEGSLPTGAGAKP